MVKDSQDVDESAVEGAASAAPSKGGKKQKKADVYVVTGALIQATVGNRALQYRVGDVLPDGVGEDELDNLLSLGLVKKQ